MTRYINADALIDNLNDLTVQVKQSAETWEVDLQVLVRSIQNCETADVRPNVRGKWVETESVFHVEKIYKCSECGHEAWGESECTDFCGGCGADMRGE